MALPPSKCSWGPSTLRKEASLGAGLSRSAAGDDKDDVTMSGALMLCLIHSQGFAWIVSPHDFSRTATQSWYLYHRNFTDAKIETHRGLYPPQGHAA